MTCIIKGRWVSDPEDPEPGSFIAEYNGVGTILTVKPGSESPYCKGDVRLKNSDIYELTASVS